MATDIGELIVGFRPDGSACCSRAEHSAEHSAEMWSRDLSGQCADGKHAGCQHRQGGRHSGGVPYKNRWTGEPMTWRCGCDCHAAELVATPTKQSTARVKPKSAARLGYDFAAICENCATFVVRVGSKEWTHLTSGAQKCAAGDLSRKTSSLTPARNPTARKPKRPATPRPLIESLHELTATPLLDRARREDRVRYSSDVADYTRCESCGGEIGVRSTGRPRRFCNATCRKRANRAAGTPT